MRRYKYILFVIVVLMLLSTVNVFAIEITIPQQVKVNYGKITLGEVAKIRGENNNIIEAIKDVELDTAPSPGYSSRLSRELIRLVLKNKGYNLENIKLNIPQVFTVKTKTKVISKDMLVDF